MARGKQLGDCSDDGQARLIQTSSAGQVIAMATAAGESSKSVV